jgi:hypothetical protein
MNPDKRKWFGTKLAGAAEAYTPEMRRTGVRKHVYRAANIYDHKSKKSTRPAPGAQHQKQAA